MRSSWAKFVKNGLSNVLNGSSAALLAVILPYFFVRHLTHLDFTIWILVLQLAAYVGYLNLGLQTAIGRYVALALGRNDQPLAESAFLAGVQLLALVAIIGFAIVCLLAWIFPYFFRLGDSQLAHIARVALLWVGGASCIGLPTNAASAVLVGLQRNGIPAIVSAVGRVLLGIALIVTVVRTSSIDDAAVIYFLVMLLTYAAQWIGFYAVCRSWNFSSIQNLGATRRDLLTYCASLAAWSVGMLLVSGLDTTIVGRFDFAHGAAYGIALSAVVFFNGLYRAFTTPLIQVFARFDARGEHHSSYALLESSTGVGAVFLIVAACWSISTSNYLFGYWVGSSIARTAYPIFVVLVVANLVRASVDPLSVHLIATGKQQHVVAIPVFEGVTNLIASIIGAYFIGAMGVAWGTLLGAVVGVMSYYAYNFDGVMRHFSKRSFFSHHVRTPLYYGVPLIASTFGSWYFALSLGYEIVFLLASTFVACFPLLSSFRRIKKTMAVDMRPAS